MTSTNDDAVILAVDDEPSNLDLIRRVLWSRSDLRFVIASSAQDGLAMLKSMHIDIMLVDHRMPGMTGVELLQRARQIGCNATGIVITGYPEDEAVQECQRSGLAQCVIAKPWDAADVLLAIDFALGMRSGKSHGK